MTGNRLYCHKICKMEKKCLTLNLCELSWQVLRPAKGKKQEPHSSFFWIPRPRTSFLPLFILLTTKQTICCEKLKHFNNYATNKQSFLGLYKIFQSGISLHVDTLLYLLDIHGNWLEMPNINMEISTLAAPWTGESSGLRAECDFTEKGKCAWYMVDFNFVPPTMCSWSFS